MSKRTENAIWFEKYRPSSLSAMALPPATLNSFNSFIEKKEIPHLLLYGPPGSGKTTIANIVIKSIGASALSINASKDRGIDVVRGDIVTFAQSKQFGDKLKIVFLDEFDQMTNDAQCALKNTMETYAKHCRFIMTANLVGKVAEPIRSRCQKFSFDQFPKLKLLFLIKSITKRELISVPANSIKKVINRFYPDIRTIINEIQCACAGGVYNASRINSPVVNMPVIEKLIIKGDIHSLRELLINISFYSDLYRWLYDVFLANHGGDHEKAEMVLSIADYHNADAHTPDKELNFVACLISIMQILNIDIKF